MSLSSVFTPTDLSNIAAGNGAKKSVPSAGQVGFHFINYTGAIVTVSDDFGNPIAVLSPWCDQTGDIAVPTTNLTFTVSSANPVQVIQGVTANVTYVSYELYQDAQPTLTTQLAMVGAGSFTINGTTAISGNVPVVNPVGATGLLMGHDTVYCGNISAANDGLTHTINVTIPAGAVTFYYMIRRPNNWYRGIKSIQVSGNVSGRIYLVDFGPFDSEPYIIPNLDPSDTQLVFTIVNPTINGGTITIDIYASYYLSTVGVTNSPGWPIFTQPVSGQNTVLSDFTTGDTAVIGNLSTILNIPKIMTGISFSGFVTQAVTGPTVQSFPNSSVWVQVGIKGTTSSTILYFANGSGYCGNTCRASAGTTLQVNFNGQYFPAAGINLANLLPTDTQFVIAYRYTINNFLDGGALGAAAMHMAASVLAAVL